MFGKVGLWWYFCIFSSFLLYEICCGPALDLPRRESSIKGQQHKFLKKRKQLITDLSAKSYLNHVIWRYEFWFFYAGNVINRCFYTKTGFKPVLKTRMNACKEICCGLWYLGYEFIRIRITIFWKRIWREIWYRQRTLILKKPLKTVTMVIDKKLIKKVRENRKKYTLLTRNC